MSRLERPLVGRTLRTTGDIVLRAPLVLGLNTNGGTWYDATFLVDTGTEMTTVPAFDARVWDLPIPVRPVPGLNLKGQEVRAGLLRARIVGMHPSEYVFPSTGSDRVIVLRNVGEALSWANEQALES